MVRFTPSPLHSGLHLTAPDGSSVVIRFADLRRLMRQRKCGAIIYARIAPDNINQWLSGFLP
ncbi:hypothetical protein ACVXG7_28210 [Enterobacter hormaechei]